MRLGSLFDGSGGFPLAGTLCGITPVWASEIEPYPIKVTKKNFPDMKHLGDITKINGAEIEPVDVVTFGSPCQDLSVAGNRAGLDGERSGLFMEAIRIIKEMRTATNGEYPTFIVWENVPGAFSSNGGEDFRTVLQEIANVTTDKHVIPRPANGWTNAGTIMGGEFSIAWRVLDAQYWGVPQRRKRIFLVADFRGERAGEILFERDGLQGDFETGEETGKEAAEGAGGCTSAAITFKERAGCEGGGKGILIQHNKAATLATNNDQAVLAEQKAHVVCIAENTIDRQIQNGGNGVGAREDVSYTLNCNHEQPIIGTHTVRRLTPLECCRLQGFPDWWCDGIEGSDSAQYKMWGNGIALPCAVYVLAGIADIERKESGT